MKDTVTYPLSAITGDEEESRIDQLERELVTARAELAEVKEQLRLCNVDQFTTAAELAEAKAQRDLAVEALEIIKECFTTEAMFSETATAAMTASMIKKVLKECVE